MRKEMETEWREDMALLNPEAERAKSSRNSKYMQINIQKTWCECTISDPITTWGGVGELGSFPALAVVSSVAMDSGIYFVRQWGLLC